MDLIEKRHCKCVLYCWSRQKNKMGSIDTIDTIDTISLEIILISKDVLVF